MKKYVCYNIPDYGKFKKVNRLSHFISRKHEVLFAAHTFNSFPTIIPT